MKKIITTAVVVIIMFLLETSVFGLLSYGRVVPNLLIFIVSVYGLIRGEYDGIFVGFFSGLLLDIFFMDVLGFYALVYMLIGYFNGQLNAYYVIKQDFMLPLAAITLSNIALLLIDYVFFYLLNGRFYFADFLLHTLIPELIYTLGLAIVFYPLLIILEFKFIQVEFRRSDSDV